MRVSEPSALSTISRFILGLVLNSLEHHNGTKQHLIAMLQRFYEGITDITTR